MSGAMGRLEVFLGRDAKMVFAAKHGTLSRAVFCCINSKSPLPGKGVGGWVRTNLSAMDKVKGMQGARPCPH